MTLSKLAQDVILMNCTEGMPGLNLSWNMDYTEVYHGFPHSLQQTAI